MIGVFSVIITLIIVLTLAAIGGSLSERSGIINLSIEGFMTIGAVSYATIAGLPSIMDTSYANQFWLIPIAGMFTGIFASLYAFVTVKLKANQTIAGIALNSLALAISMFLLHTDSINHSGSGSYMNVQDRFWSLGETNQDFGYIINTAVMLGIPIIAIIVIMLNTTKFGKKIKAVGENPHAAASLGVRVENVQFVSVILSGIFSGIAGAIFAQTSSVFRGSTQGLGFLAVAIVVFGQWKPTFIILGGILFGLTFSMADQYQMFPFLESFESYDILKIIPYALSLGILIFTSKNAKAPKALGIPYSNAGR